MSATLDDPLARHFTLLAYPFKHVFSPAMSPRRLRLLEDRWRPWWSRIEVDHISEILSSTYFFLPGMQAALFPEMEHLSHQASQEQIRHVKDISSCGLRAYCGGLRQEAVVHLTLTSEHLQPLHPLRLISLGEDRSTTSISLQWVDVSLFPQQVGFLLMKLEVESNALSVLNFLEVLRGVRVVHPTYSGEMLTHWEWGTESHLPFANQDLIEYLLQGLVENSDRFDTTLSDYLERRSRGGTDQAYTDTPVGRVYGSVFREFSFACLETDSTREVGDVRQADQLAPAFGSSHGQSRASTSIASLLYALATCTRVEHPDEEPHRVGLRDTMERGHIALWANWEALALHDNVVFLGTRPSPFTLQVLPRNIEVNYFPLFVLALYQKFRLSLLSSDLIQHRGALQTNVRQSRRSWNTFVQFSNHFWAAEVTLRPQGNALYRKFHDGLDIRPLYLSVNEEARRLREYFESQADHRIQTLLNFVTFVGLPTTILAQVLGTALSRGVTWAQIGVVGVIVYAASALVWLLWNRYGSA